jgi:hypothetical protein
MGTFPQPLELEYMDGRYFKLTADFVYEVNNHRIVTVPKGFVTDFASVPKILWNVLPPTGSYGKAAVIHDWLYQFRTTEDLAGRAYPEEVWRYQADWILLGAMKSLGVSGFTRHVIYWGVRLGGWVPWARYRLQEVS